MNWPEFRWARRLPTAFVVNVATLGPIGKRLPAPGTWGSVAGLLYTLLFFRRMSWEQMLVWSIIASFVAVIFCGEAARRLGKEDPGEVILDEFAVMPLVFLGWRGALGGLWPEWAIFLAGLALFRVFDILKPLGISRLQSWPGGWGIVVDDFAAALAACGVLHVLGWCVSFR